MSSEKFANDAQTTLDGAIDDTTTSIVVTSATAFPTTGNFRILVGTELMLVTGVSGVTFTATRGVEGTVAVSHTNNRPVTCIVTDGAVDNLKREVTGFNGVAFRNNAGAAATYGAVPRIGGTQVYNELASVAGYRAKSPVMAGHVDVADFGAVPDWNGTTGTDNLAAFAAALAYLKDRAVGAGEQNFTGKLVCDGHYYFSDTLHIRQTVLIQGSGRAADIQSAVGRSGPGTMFVFPEDCDGIYVHGADTANIAYNSAIRDLCLFCKDTRAGGTYLTNGAYPPAGHTGSGVLIETPTIVDNLLIIGFAEDGIQAQGGTGFNGGIEGTSISNCIISKSGRHGIAFYGNDGHVNKIETCTSYVAWGYGFFDDSGVGCTWINCLGQANCGTGVTGGVGFDVDGFNHDYGSGFTWAGFCGALFLGCYTEGNGNPPSNEIMFPGGAIGNLLGDPNSFGATATGFAMSSAGLIGVTPIIWRKALATSGVAAALGVSGDADAAMDFSPFGVTGGTSLRLRQNQASVYPPSGWWSLDYHDGSSVGIANVIRFPSALANGRYINRAPWMPHGVLLGTGNGLDFGQQLQIAGAAVPTLNDRDVGFTYEKGDIVWNTDTPETFAGSICTVAGTQDALGAITGTITNATAALVVNDATGLYRGAYITIATVSGVYKITAITGLNVTIDPVAASGATNQAIDYSPATFRTFGAP